MQRFSDNQKKHKLLHDIVGPRINKVLENKIGIVEH